MKDKIKTYTLTIVLIFTSIFTTNTVKSQCAVIAPVPNDACYNQVIIMDTWCCNTSWDGLCQMQYDDCFATLPTGCSVPQPASAPDDGCYNMVILNNPSCCDVAWDASCQDEYDNCTSETFGCTGGVQFFTVPDCITEITVIADGAQGGGPFGGNGAQVYGTVTVTPGQILQVNVGCQGTSGVGGGGYGGGGGGQPSGLGWPSFGGGGASYVSFNPYGMANAFIVGGGGGGTAAGDMPGAGGAAGCPNGTAGTSPFGQGGQGGTSTAGGNGGPPWTPGGGPGQNGSFGQGGNGGPDIQFGNNPGGGGGGGYYGGGGGGSDNISGTGAVGGGGGGAGSSLIPAVGGCNQGVNTGNGQVIIAYGCETTNPTASNPAPITVQCVGDVPAPNIAVITDAADNCTITPLVTHIGDVSDGNTCPQIITRTYRVIDDCENFIDLTQTITINDDIPPTASNPADITVVGILNVPAPDIAVVTDEADNCTAAPLVTHVSDVSDGNNCPEIITRTYSVTDACGNQTLVTQIITVSDITPPTASNPLPINVQCIGDVPVPDISVVTDAADNNGPPTVAHVSDVSDGNTCPEIITRTYSVTDDCGNGITVTQTITINDDIAPTGAAPANVNVQCVGDIPAVNIASVTGVSDNCTAVPTVFHVSDISNGNTCPETITRTYSITDNCGNQTLVTQIITVNDDVPPVASNPIDITINSGPAPAPNISLVTGVSDNCTVNPIVAHISDVSDGNICPEVITRTYSVTDDCGNQILVSHLINIFGENPNVEFTADTLAGCKPLTVLFTNSSSPSQICIWNFGDGTSSVESCGNVTHTFQNAGSYDISLFIQNAGGCTNSLVLNNYIEVYEVPVASFTFSPSVPTVENTEIQFNNNSQNANSYEWSFGIGGMTSIQESPTFIYPEIGNVAYNVMLVANSINGCTDTFISRVEIKDIILFFVPNAFTPDGDNKNNTFQPVFTSGFNPYDYHLMIFNRWGELIFESYNAEIGWDGTYLGELVQDGTYIWKIDFGETMSDKKHTHNGHVTLIK